MSDIEVDDEVEEQHEDAEEQEEEASEAEADDDDEESSQQKGKKKGAAAAAAAAAPAKGKGKAAAKGKESKAKAAKGDKKTSPAKRKGESAQEGRDERSAASGCRATAAEAAARSLELQQWNQIQQRSKIARPVRVTHCRTACGCLSWLRVRRERRRWTGSEEGQNGRTIRPQGVRATIYGDGQSTMARWRHQATTCQKRNERSKRAAGSSRSPAHLFSSSDRPAPSKIVPTLLWSCTRIFTSRSRSPP